MNTTVRSTDDIIAVLRQHLTQIEGTKVVPVAPIAKALGYPRGRELSRACPPESKRYIQLEGRPTSLAVTLEGFIQMVFRSSKPEMVALQGALVGLMVEGLSDGNEGREASPEPSHLADEAETQEGREASPAAEPEDAPEDDQEGREASPDVELPFNLPEVTSLSHNNHGTKRSLVEVNTLLLDQGITLPDHLAPWNWLKAQVPHLRAIAEREGLPSALDLASFSTMYQSAWARGDIAQMYLDELKAYFRQMTGLAT